MPLDKSVSVPACSIALMAALMHVRQHSLLQLCLRWSKLSSRKTLRAQPSFCAVMKGQLENSYSYKKKQNKGSLVYSSPLPLSEQRLHLLCDHPAEKL